MDIIFATSRIARLCNDSHEAEKRWTQERARLIRKRLDELADADDLSVVRFLPQARCHELKGDRKGQLAVDLDGLWRLIFKPHEDPPPQKGDGGLDWHSVHAIVVLAIEDYHD